MYNAQLHNHLLQLNTRLGSAAVSVAHQKLPLNPPKQLLLRLHIPVFRNHRPHPEAQKFSLQRKPMGRMACTPTTVPTRQPSLLPQPHPHIPPSILQYPGCLMDGQSSRLISMRWQKSRGGDPAQISATGSTTGSTRSRGRRTVTEDATWASSGTRSKRTSSYVVLVFAVRELG